MKHANNLKQLVLAMLNYAETHQGQLPPAVVYSPDGRPLYSWRVALLPYLEQQALYDRFKKDEPWDSPTNQALLAEMPAVFALPGSTGRSTKTYYQVFVGPHTPWEDDGRRGPSLPASFLDGTSNTILIAEAMHGVDWTKPDDINLGAGKNPRLLLGHHLQSGKCFVGMADGAVRTISVTGISDQTLRNAIDPKDGMPLGSDFGS